MHLEGNEYFPTDALHEEYFRKSSAHSLCPWKGIASYFDVIVDGVVNPQAAWYYAHPIPWARRVKGRVAFWGGIEIQSIDEEQHLSNG